MPSSDDEEFEFRARAEKEAAPAAVTPPAAAAPSPDARAPGETTMSDLITGRKPKEAPRLSERLGDAWDNGVSVLGLPGGNALKRAAGVPEEALPRPGRATALSIDSMAQAIRQYFPGMDHEAATKAAKEIAEKQDKLSTSDRISGEIIAGALPGGAVGKLASGAKVVGDVSKAAKVAQALKTVGAGGATAAALTPALDDSKSIGEQKLEQFGEGAATTGALGAAGNVGNRVVKAAKEALSPEQRAASVAKAMDAAGIKLGPTRGSATQTAAAGSLKKADTARTDAFNEHAKDARLDPTPIPTDRTVDTLERAAQTDVKDGKRMYRSIIDELHKPSLTKAGARDFELDSHRLENVRNAINQLKNNGFNGQPIGQARAAVLDKALKELDDSARAAIPKWGQAFDAFKAKSPAVDTLSKTNGSVAGAATAKAADRGGFDKQFTTPSRDVIDGYLSKGPAGMKAAAEATAKSPRARAEIRTKVVNDLLGTKGSIDNEWAGKSRDLVKSGLFTPDEANRVDSVIAEYKRVMSTGDTGKPKNVVGAIVGSMLKIPGLSKVMKAGKELGDSADARTVSEAKKALIRATLDPQYGKVLMGLPTPKNIQTALTAMQRGGAITAGQIGAAETAEP